MRTITHRLPQKADEPPKSGCGMCGKRDLQREQPGRHDLGGLDAAAVDREPSPLEAVILADTVEQLMRFATPLERTVIELRLQGCTYDEIAEVAGRTQRTVIRTIEKIKDRLRDQGFAQPDHDG